MKRDIALIEEKCFQGPLNYPRAGVEGRRDNNQVTATTGSAVLALEVIF
jgi:hypothetical protein